MQLSSVQTVDLHFRENNVEIVDSHECKSIDACYVIAFAIKAYAQENGIEIARSNTDMVGELRLHNFLYQTMRTPIDEEIKSLQNQMDDDLQKKTEHNGLDLEGILSSLRSMIDFGDSKIDHGIVDQFVYKVISTSDNTFDWYLNLNDGCNIRAKVSVMGHKKKCVIELEEIEKISSLHRTAKADMIAYLLNTPSILSLLHRLH